MIPAGLADAAAPNQSFKDVRLRRPPLNSNVRRQLTTSAAQSISRKLFVLLFSAMLMGCGLESAVRAGPIHQQQIGWGTRLQEVHDVSVIELLGRPSEFDGQPVRVIGVAQFDLGFEGSSAVYASTEDQRHVTHSFVGIASFSPGLAAPRGELEKLTGRFVLIEGIFRARPLYRIPRVPGSTTVCVGDCGTGGTLEDVSYIGLWEF